MDRNPTSRPQECPSTSDDVFAEELLEQDLLTLIERLVVHPLHKESSGKKLTVVTPRRACAAKGLSDCSWTGLYSFSVCKNNFKTQKILAFRSPFQHRKTSVPIQWPPV